MVVLILHAGILVIQQMLYNFKGAHQRNNETGDVRFNSPLGVFEGFSTGTVTFGGVFDDSTNVVQVHSQTIAFRF